MGWAVPERILAQAPESPWGFLPGMFTVDHDEAPLYLPSRRIALNVLGTGGSVLDVGSGGGSASLSLVPAVTSIIGVDEREDVLEQLQAGAAARGVPCQTVEGAWPDVAPLVEPADVVVCHHVLYNEPPDAVAFVQQLTSHARRMVVMELNALHPLVYLAPLWQRFRQLERPDGPAASDAVAIVRELSIEPRVALAERPGGHWRSPDQQVPLARKRLCLPASRRRDRRGTGRARRRPRPRSGPSPGPAPPPDTGVQPSRRAEPPGRLGPPVHDSGVARRAWRGG